jgi:hypothetical protein
MVFLTAKIYCDVIKISCNCPINFWRLSFTVSMSYRESSTTFEVHPSLSLCVCVSSLLEKATLRRPSCRIHLRPPSSPSSSVVASHFPTPRSFHHGRLLTLALQPILPGRPPIPPALTKEASGGVERERERWPTATTKTSPPLALWSKWAHVPPSPSFADIMHIRWEKSEMSVTLSSNEFSLIACCLKVHLDH